MLDLSALDLPTNSFLNPSLQAIELPPEVVGGPDFCDVGMGIFGAEICGAFLIGQDPGGCFPKKMVVNPPKWMVYNGSKPRLKWMIWGYHYFWKHPGDSSRDLFIS